MLVTCSYTDCTIALKLSAIDISKNVYKMYVIISRNFGISDIRSDHLGEWGGEELCCVLISFPDLGQYLQGHMRSNVVEILRWGLAPVILGHFWEYYS